MNTATANLSRRKFIQVSLSGGALLVAAPLSQSATSGRPGEEQPQAGGLTPLVKIDADNSITFYYPSPEMGQGVDTSLALLFIEELGGDIELVSVQPLPYLIKLDAEGKIAPVAVPQGAGGSTSISRNFPLLREAGATTRQLFLQAAARVLSQPIESLRAEQSYIVSSSGQRLPFGGLVAQASKEILPQDFKPQLKDPQQWNTIGKHTASMQTHKIVTGQPLYGMDMEYPGAKTAVVVRSPYLDGYPQSVDSSKARKMSGVIDVVELERPDPDAYYTYLAAGVAVIAEDFWTAKKASEALLIKWNKGPHTAESSDSLHRQCDELLQGKGQIVRDDGNFDSALAAADKVVKRTYRLPLVSHAQLEPQNCIAHVTEDMCRIIGPMQSPGGASRLAAEITGFERVDIEINYTRLGGGFGRRLTSDHVAEAVTIAKKSGLPIKLIWTREDDMAHDFYRPMGHHEMIAATNRDGEVTAWAHRLAGTPKYYRRNGVKADELFGADLYVDDFPAGLVSNLRNEYSAASSGAPQGSWRAPAHTANAFVVESFIDELAREFEIDPLALRLQLLGEPQQLEYNQHGGPVYDTGRMATALQAAAKLAGWGRKAPKRTGLGIAGHFTFGGYCAQVAEVELLSDSSVKVHKVYAAIDVGIVINPEGVIAQIEGGINDGLSTAMGQQIRIKGGQVSTDNFDSYPMLRIADSVTDIEVQIIDSGENPSGVGEMGLPPLAPAVANAIHAAGGKRLRSQPFNAELAKS